MRERRALDVEERTGRHDIDEVRSNVVGLADVPAHRATELRDPRHRLVPLVAHEAEPAPVDEDAMDLLERHWRVEPVQGPCRSDAVD